MTIYALAKRLYSIPSNGQILFLTGYTEVDQRKAFLAWMQDQISGEARQSGECESERLQFTSSSPHTKEKLIITLIFAKDESGTMEQHTFVRKKKKKGTKREKKKMYQNCDKWLSRINEGK